MVGVKTWTDDAIWFVILASDILKPQTSSPGRNGRPSRRYTDEQIARLCQQYVQDLNHRPDANGVKYVRGSKKADYYLPNAPQPSPTILAVIERLRHQSNTPLPNQNFRSGSISRNERIPTNNTNVQGSSSSAHSGNTGPISRSRGPTPLSFSRSPRPTTLLRTQNRTHMQDPPAARSSRQLHVQSPPTYSHARTIHNQQMLRNGQLSVAQFHALSGVNSSEADRLRSMEIGARSYNGNEDHNNQRADSAVNTQAPRSVSRPGAGSTMSLGPEMRSNLGSTMLRYPSHFNDGQQQSMPMQHHGNHFSHDLPHMSMGSMHTRQGYDMDFSTPPSQEYMHDFNSGLSMNNLWQCGNVVYPQSQQEFNGNSMMEFAGQSGNRGSYSSFNASYGQPNDAMMLRHGFSQMSHPGSYEEQDKAMMSNLGAQPISVSNIPANFDFNGMSADQFRSNGLPQATSQESALGFTTLFGHQSPSNYFDGQNASQQLPNSFTSHGANQSFSSNFVSPSANSPFSNNFGNQGDVSSQQSSYRNVRKQQRDLDEDSNPDMDSYDRKAKRHRGEVLEPEQMNNHIQEGNSGQASIERRPRSTPGLSTRALAVTPAIAPSAASTVAPNVAPITASLTPGASNIEPVEDFADYSANPPDDEFGEFVDTEPSIPVSEPVCDQIQEDSPGNLEPSPTGESARRTFDTPPLDQVQMEDPTTLAKSDDMSNQSLEGLSEQVEHGSPDFDFDLPDLPGIDIERLSQSMDSFDQHSPSQMEFDFLSN